jgi:hydrogenase expression/formation protein HypC
MCLGLPMIVVELRPGDVALAEYEGVRKEVSVALLAGDVAVGDFVLVHVGFALSKIDPERARETLALLAEIAGLEAR